MAKVRIKRKHLEVLMEGMELADVNHLLLPACVEDGFTGRCKWCEAMEAAEILLHK